MPHSYIKDNLYHIEGILGQHLLTMLGRGKIHTGMHPSTSIPGTTVHVHVKSYRRHLTIAARAVNVHLAMAGSESELKGKCGAGHKPAATPSRYLNGN